MSNELKLRFKGYELAYNPNSFDVKKERNIVQINSPLSGSIVQDLGFNPAVITGEGNLFGADAKKQYDEIYSLLLKNKSGLLHIPGIKPFFAYFVSINTTHNAGPNLINYKFKFVEDCNTYKSGLKI